MSRSHSVKTIDEIEYTIYLYPMETAFYNLDLLMLTYGEPLLKLGVESMTSQQEGGSGDIPVSKISEALASLRKSLSPGDSMKLIKTLLNKDYIKTGATPFSLEKSFNEKGFFHVLKLMAIVIKENYLDFLSVGSESQP